MNCPTQTENGSNAPALTSDIDEFRVAIIGCGPKGLYCLESLSRKLQASREALCDRRIKVIVYEPSAFPGAGTIYSPDQPHVLRMNFASRFVNAWTEETRDCSSVLTLSQWLSQHYPRQSEPNAFVPRALVGEYLYACWLRVVQTLKVHANVEVRKNQVTQVERIGSTWLVACGDSKKADAFHEIMVTVGHQGWRAAAASFSASVNLASSPLATRNVRDGLASVRARNNSSLTRPLTRFVQTSACAGGDRIPTIVDCPFPVTLRLGLDKVPPGASVVVRGFALTWIDTTLALTEGRGGEFIRTADGLRYASCGLEPKCIRPFSRSGRPMLPKPCLDRVTYTDVVESVWKEGRHAILKLGQTAPIDFESEIWPVVMSSSVAALHLIHEDSPTQVWHKHVESWWRRWLSNTMTAEQALDHLRRAYRVAIGEDAPDAAWALGETWRQLYPALVSKISHGGLAIGSWDGFRAISAELERIAFGPPAENVARMLALIEAGFVRFDWPDNDQHEAVDAGAAVDILINGMVPGPEEIQDDSVLSRLLQQGLVRRAAGARGIEVNENARPIDRLGNVVGGLAVIGRTTEGSILGNDTLSRRMHAHPDRWAKEVVRHAVSSNSKIPGWE